MPKSTKERQKRLNLQLRETLANAYTFIRSRQYTESVANITYEELLDQAVGRIEGTEGRNEVRSTKLERVQKIKSEISQAVATVKSRPPQEWAIEGDENVAEEDRANTPEKP